MIKNYLKVALRNVLKQRIFSTVNIICLAIGMAGFTIFAHMAGVKLQSDKFHEHARDIYGVVQVTRNEQNDESHSAYTPGPLLPALREELPEIILGVRVLPTEKVVVSYGDNSFNERGLLFVDDNFLSLFSFELLNGDPAQALAEPGSVVLSETVARKYFGEKNPLGEVLTLERNVPLTVTGVLRDIPRTSSMRLTMLAPIESARRMSNALDDWSTNALTTFLMLPRGVRPPDLAEKLEHFRGKFWADTAVSAERSGSPEKLYLFPLLDFRLRAGHIDSFLASTNMTGVVIIFTFGILLLVIVSLNYINLSTARYMARTREIGLRKVIGARRNQLIVQFLTESLCLSFAAVPLTIIFYEMVHPVLTRFVGSAVFVTTVPNSVLNYPFLLKYIFGAALLTGIFSGLYPAVCLSSFRPIQGLRGSIFSGKSKRRGGKIMIVLQFTLSVFFIVLAGNLRQQYKNFKYADLGYNKNNVLVLPLSGEVSENRELLRTEIARFPDVLAISASADLPGVWSTTKPARRAGSNEDEAFTMLAYAVDYNFLEVLNLHLTAGRDFSRDKPDGGNFIINETAGRKLQLENAVGTQLTVGERTGTVIGVTEDFLFDDIGFGIPPAILYLDKDALNYMLIRYASADRFAELHDYVKQQWRQFAVNIPFDYSTLEDYFNEMLKIVGTLAGFINILGFASIFFSCLGLFGLASYLVKRRSVEIGVKKVLGASLSRVLWDIIKEFVVLVGIANIIALALSYFGWQAVLRTGLLFITNIGITTYVTAVLFSLAAAAFAVTSQTAKTALANPVDSLRSE